MMRDEDGSDTRTLWCGNISDQVTDEILYELFLQAGPLESVRRPRDPNGRPKSFAFIVYKHECSVPYAQELLRGEKLFNRALNLSSRSGQQHVPALGTHLNEFTGGNEWQDKKNQGQGLRNEWQDHRNEGKGLRNEWQDQKNQGQGLRNEWQDHRNEGQGLRNEGQGLRNEWQDHRNEGRGQRNGGRDHRNGGRDNRNDKRRSDKERDDNKPTSWAELNALRGKGSLLNGHSMSNRDDLLGAPIHSRESISQNVPTSVPNFEQLLQMGSQMMHPGMLAFGGSPFPAGPLNLMAPIGVMGQNMVGHNTYQSMQGGMSGSKRFSPEKNKRRSDHYEGRGSRRDHPYQDKRQDSQYDNRRHSDNYNHRRNDRGYSSSRSSHERERRGDRRSR